MGNFYAIAGATGNTGHRISEALLERGHRVRAIGRSRASLRPLVEQGAEPFTANVNDPDRMEEAFDGADAVYAMIPPNYEAEDLRAWQNDVGSALAVAIGNAGVEYVVALSSLGAHLETGTGPIAGLHDFEQHLKIVADLNAHCLRPTFFMENLLFQVEIIRRMGCAGSPLREDVAFPMIAIRDVADYALERLEKLDFDGFSFQELLGPADLTISQAVEALGRAIGKPKLAYVEFPYEDFGKGLQNAGFSSDAAASMIELYRAINEGKLQPATPRSEKSTTATTIGEFAKVFAAIYKQEETGK